MAFENRDVDACLLEGHGSHGSGHPPADNDYLHRAILSLLGYLGSRVLLKPKDRSVRKQRQALILEAGNAMQAYQRSTQAFDDAVGRAIGLNPTDLRCLDWLVDGPKAAGELSEGTGLSSAATTSLIDRLEHKGFVRRVRDP